MRTLLLYLLLTLFFFGAFPESKADDYKILYVNSKNLKIGNEIAKNGMVFRDVDNIFWTNPNQRIRVRNLTSKNNVTISPGDFGKDEPNNLYYLFVTKPLTTRDMVKGPEILPIPVPMLDILYLAKGKETGPDLRYYLEIKTEEGSEKILLDTNPSSGNMESLRDGEEEGLENVLVLTRDLFSEKKLSCIESYSEDSSCPIIKVVIKVNNGKLEYPLYEDLQIQLLPLSID